MRRWLLETTLAGLIDKARAASSTAAGHTKRLLHQSFHADPRALIEELVRSQRNCMAS
jgi:hypothetical protein